MDISILAASFAAVAAIYSSVGFGGGSTYTAVLLLAGVPVLLVPLVSLSCNLLVTSAGAVRSIRAGLLKDSRVWSLFALSVPCAFLGGITPISVEVLTLLLAFALLVSGVQMLWASSNMVKPLSVKAPSYLPSVLGAWIGYLSGLVGIGGGIFLAPVLHLIGWDSPRRISAIATCFIAVNSFAALAGKLIAFDRGGQDWNEAFGFWPLLLAVVGGSLFGHRLMLKLLSETLIKRATAVLIILVSLRLLALQVF